MCRICILLSVIAVAVFLFGCSPNGKNTQLDKPQFTAKEATPEKKIEFWSQKAPQNSFVRDLSSNGRVFMPTSSEGLLKSVQKYIEEANSEKVEGEIVGLLVPHAGYVCSGPVAGFAYKLLLGTKYDVVVILGADHTGSPTTLAKFDFFRMPFGDVPLIGRDQANALAKEAGISYEPAAHMEEHSIEVQLPFLCAVLKDFSIVPISVGQEMREEPQKCDRLVNELANFIKGKKALIIISTDLSHYPSYDIASAADKEFLEALKTLDADKLLEADKTILSPEWAKRFDKNNARELNLHCTACGIDAVIVALKLFKKLGVDGYKLLKYANSFDTTKESKERVVGYAAACFFRSANK
jgi:AmmeMemoRadiSam system protein B